MSFSLAGHPWAFASHPTPLPTQQVSLPPDCSLQHRGQPFLYAAGLFKSCSRRKTHTHTHTTHTHMHTHICLQIHTCTPHSYTLTHTLTSSPVNSQTHTLRNTHTLTHKLTHTQSSLIAAKIKSKLLLQLSGTHYNLVESSKPPSLTFLPLFPQPHTRPSWPPCSHASHLPFNSAHNS